MRKQSQVSRFAHEIRFLTNISKTEADEAKWIEFLTSFAEVRSVVSSTPKFLEVISFGELLSESYFHFKIRYIKGIKKTMRIEFDHRLFEIQRITNFMEKNVILNILALEV